MANRQDEIMMEISKSWVDMLDRAEEDENTLFTADGTNFSARAKRNTVMVEAYREDKDLVAAKLGYNEDIDGAGTREEWESRVVEAMNYANDWMRERMDVSAFDGADD